MKHDIKKIPRRFRKKSKQAKRFTFKALREREANKESVG